MYQTINKGFANNSYLVAKQDSQLNEFRPLDDQPEFPIEVHGRHIIARLTGRINNPVQWQLIVEFSDGVTDIFYLPGESSKEWFAANKKNIAYAKAATAGLMNAFKINYSNFKY